MYEINETHDPNLKSWVESANDPNTDFPIQNLPFLLIDVKDDSYDGGRNRFNIAVAIGDSFLNLSGCSEDGLFDSLPSAKYGFDESALYSFGLESQKSKTEVRIAIQQILSDQLSEDKKLEVSKHLYKNDAIKIVDSIFQIGDYTDFYCSIYHATNVGSMFRPDNPLMPNYKYVPIGYHGRASSIVISGTDVKRPHGQNRSDQDAPPVFIPAKNLDYEMELGFFVGKGNEMGEPINIADAEKHIFGVCLVNDWSARDIQAWEYQPLGPFLAKNFATTISPYVVTMEALAPFRTPAFERPDDPQPLDYLNDEQNQKFGGLDINLEVYIQTEKMRNENIEPHLLSRSNTKDLYWNIGQMLTHHASNGCNLQTGDLIASGTVSGKEKDERGCLLELTWRGTEPLELPNGEQRRFLEDGDEVIMKASATRRLSPHSWANAAAASCPHN